MLNNSIALDYCEGIQNLVFAICSDNSDVLHEKRESMVTVPSPLSGNIKAPLHGRSNINIPVKVCEEQTGPLNKRNRIIQKARTLREGESLLIHSNYLCEKRLLYVRLKK